MQAMQSYAVARAHSPAALARMHVRVWRERQRWSAPFASAMHDVLLHAGRRAGRGDEIATAGAA